MDEIIEIGPISIISTIQILGFGGFGPRNLLAACPSEVQIRSDTCMDAAEAQAGAECHVRYGKML